MVLLHPVLDKLCIVKGYQSSMGIGRLCFIRGAKLWSLRGAGSGACTGGIVADAAVGADTRSAVDETMLRSLHEASKGIYFCLQHSWCIFIFMSLF